MRAAVRTRVLVCALLSAAASSGSGCIPDKNEEPDLLKPPESWNPKADEMTFGEKNLQAFNDMSEAEREAHVEALKQKAASFKGQARFQRVSEMGANMADSELGKFVVDAQLEEPVLYEITSEYQLFANEKIGDGIPTGTPIEFTGTLADLEYRNDAKPRKLVIKLKDVSLERLGN